MFSAAERASAVSVMIGGGRMSLRENSGKKRRNVNESGEFEKKM
jgi:hypothetical protein